MEKTPVETRETLFPLGEHRSGYEAGAKGLSAPFAWYGGKAYYARWIIGAFPQHRVYIEPFGGAANILLRKRPSEVEVFNDLDDRVVNFFRVLRDEASFERLVRKLSLTPYSRGEFAALAATPEPEDPVERAWWFFVRCRQAVGGLGMGDLGASSWALSLRTRRGMAEPVSKYLSAIDGLEPIAERFRNVVIEHRPALELIEKHDAEDAFFYCDPPYVPETRHGGKAATYGCEMTYDDHVELLGALKRCRASVMISGYASELYEKELRDWRREALTTKAHLKNSGAERTEVVWMNY